MNLSHIFVASIDAISYHFIGLTWSDPITQHFCGLNKSYFQSNHGISVARLHCGGRGDPGGGPEDLFGDQVGRGVDCVYRRVSSRPAQHFEDLSSVPADPL